MEYGFNIPNGGPLATPQAIETIAQRGEALGFAILAIPDHIVFPRHIDSRYPYSASGKFGFDATMAGDFLEPFALMAHLAGVTSKARLLTSVIVVPYRHPVLTAKLVSTIDVLSGGRVILGCGVGWMEEEFGPVGAPPFKERGKVTDEYIAAFRELWTNPDPRFDGAYTSFSDIYAEPKPVQKPLPIWIGGESPPALRRAARLGDGWYPIGCNPHHPMDTLERFATMLATMHGFAEEAGRDPQSIELAHWAVWYGGDAPIAADNDQRQLFTGNADDVAGDIRALEDLGLRSLVFNFLRESVEETLETMERFTKEVLPLVR